MSRQIALIEDEPVIRQNYEEALARHGYKVVSFTHREEAEQALRKRLPDLAIIDISLGEDVEGGFELCRSLRSMSPALPIIFLTARDSDFDVVSGLRLGADDFITKDVSIHQILARVAALFRRVEAMQKESAGTNMLRTGDLSIDLNCMQVEWKGEKVPLTLTEFWILNSLARFPGHVKSREQLMQDASIFVDEGTVTSHVKRLRRKFESIDPDFDCIETVYGMGYRWQKR